MSITLKEIISFYQPFKLINFNTENDFNLTIEHISNDTRKIYPNTLFVAIRGENFDSHLKINEVINKGAIAIVVEYEFNFSNINVPIIVTKSSFDFLKTIAARFYSYPSKNLYMVGITGTNGKTTTSYLAQSILTQKYSQCGLIGTIKYIVGNNEYEALNTTPEPLTFQKLLYDMNQSNIKACVMEVSSHAIKLKRIENTEFDVLIFTNLSKEHTELHPDMNDYFNTKASIFFEMFNKKNSSFKKPGYAIINTDNEYGLKLANELKKINNSLVFTISLNENTNANLTAKILDIKMDGIDFCLKYNKFKKIINLKLPGIFNVYNALAAAALGICSNLSFDEIKIGLENVYKIPGRFERVNIIGLDYDFNVYIDFAHTPESILNILKLAKDLKPNKIITVFGCGGNRSREKRPLMGYNAITNSDFTIITSDNPRFEEPLEIINDILTGINNLSNYKVILDRKEAINYAISMANKNDIVLILGKGHEKYQIIKNEKLPFDDYEIAKEAIKNKYNS